MDKELKEPILNFADKLAEAGVIVTEKLIEVAPEVANSFLKLVQAKGIFAIVFDLIVFAVFSIITFVMIGKWKELKEWDSKLGHGDQGVLLGFYTLSIFIIGGVAITRLFIVFNFYNWVSAFYPEGAIAIRALEAVGIVL